MPKGRRRGKANAGSCESAIDATSGSDSLMSITSEADTSDTRFNLFHKDIHGQWKTRLERVKKDYLKKQASSLNTAQQRDQRRMQAETRKMLYVDFLRNVLQDLASSRTADAAAPACPGAAPPASVLKRGPAARQAFQSVHFQQKTNHVATGTTAAGTTAAGTTAAGTTAAGTEATPPPAKLPKLEALVSHEVRTLLRGMNNLEELRAVNDYVRCLVLTREGDEENVMTTVH